jgi:hypothetical protein
VLPRLQFGHADRGPVAIVFDQIWSRLVQAMAINQIYRIRLVKMGFYLIADAFTTASQALELIRVGIDAFTNRQLGAKSIYKKVIF